MINIHDAPYSALGNNPVADTAAFEAALLVGGTIYAPGEYLIANDLFMTIPGTQIVGDNRWVSKVKAYDNSKIIRLLSANASGCAIKHITLDGNRANGGTESNGETTEEGNQTSGFYVTADHCEVTDTIIHDFGWQGVLVRSGGDYFTLSDNILHHNGSAEDRWGAGFKAWTTPGHSRPWDIKLVRNHFHHNYGLVGLPAGSAAAIDAVNVLFAYNTCENNYNNGGQVPDNGANNISRRWRGGFNSFLIENEPEGCSTCGYELTGLHYSFAGDIFDGGGAAYVFTPSGNGSAGDANITGAVMMNMAGGVFLMNSPDGTGGTRYVNIIGTRMTNMSYAGIVAQSRTTRCTVNTMVWEGVSPHVDDTSDNGVEYIRTVS